MIRKRVMISFPAELYNEFKNYCKATGRKVSTYLQVLMKEKLENGKKEVRRDVK